MAINIGDAVLNITGDAAGLEKTMSGLQSTIKQHGMVAASAISAMGAAIVGSIGLAVSEAVSFEDAFAGIRKTVEATEPEFQAMSAAILDLSTKIPVTANELAKIGEIAGQLGISKENIVAFSKTIADLAMSSNVAGEEGALMIAQFMNITGTPQKEVRNLASAIVDLGNNSATTENDILQLGQRIAGAGTLV